MGVASPEEMAGTFIERFNARDEPGMRELYAPDGVLTFDGAEYARGADEIKFLLHRLMGSPMKIRGQYVSVTVAGDIALCSLRWESLDPEGWIDQDGVSVEVLRRSPDGLWRFAIDDVTGASRQRD